ncbi:MAG TPA: DUF4157 domain-containing protein [Actinomycetota bacterium]|nr:DUF4157 domain-containing protein [Actinomycetota bacterium]
MRRSTAAVETVLASPGSPLDRRTRFAMEARFAHDFSDVRVHTDDRAAESARSIDAAAYTYRRDIVFGAGRYRPGTSDGDRLLAHELAHVVQQRAASPSARSIEVGDPRDAAEAEAESAASRAVARPARRHAAIRRQFVTPLGPGGHGVAPARAGAGGSLQPGQFPSAAGFGTIPAQHVRASVPAKVLLFGPSPL